MGCDTGRGKRGTEVGLYCMKTWKGNLSGQRNVCCLCLRHRSVPPSRCAFSYGVLATKLLDLHTAKRSAEFVASNA